MATIQPGRLCAQIEGDFVVFVIGARINQFRSVHKWLPVALAMPRMIRELMAQPELGLLHAESFVAWRTVLMLQYWRSYDHLHTYAHARDKQHLPAWSAFNQAARGNQAVGIYHETYLVKAGEYESIYANMPLFGLARAGNAVPAVGSMQTASQRLHRTPNT